MRLRILFRCLALTLTGMAIAPATASATLLSTLISLDQSVTFGTLKFSGFSYSATGDMPSDLGVTVSTYTDGAGDIGLIFQGAFIDFAPGTGSDALIGFTVTELDPSRELTGATLAGNPAVQGGTGSASVTETFLPNDTSLMLTIFNNSPGAKQLVDSGSFATSETTVMVQKDLLAFSGSVNGGVPTMSFVTQTFHETGTAIPEPASLTLLILSLLGFAFGVRCHPWLLVSRRQG